MADPPRRAPWDDLSSFAASAVRLGAGFVVRTDRLGPRPAAPLVLYDYEACPYCRRVRETLSELDLPALIKPCPRGGTRFRPEVAGLGDRRRFPQLHDPSTGARLGGAQRIVRYLYAQYGKGRPLLPVQLGPLALPTSALASFLRRGRGRDARPSRAPAAPLELASYEASRYARFAREVLCELELSYLLVNVARRSPSRPAFVARSGKMQVPWLHDPSTGVALFESAEIVAYLERTYGR